MVTHVFIKYLQKEISIFWFFSLKVHALANPKNQQWVSGLICTMWSSCLNIIMYLQVWKCFHLVHIRRYFKKIKLNLTETSFVRQFRSVRFQRAQNHWQNAQHDRERAIWKICNVFFTQHGTSELFWNRSIPVHLFYQFMMWISHRERHFALGCKSSILRTWAVYSLLKTHESEHSLYQW